MRCVPTVRLLPFLLALLAAWTTASGAAAAVIAYEAETAVLSNATVATAIKGFSGSGYVDIADAVGSYVEFTVTVGSSGRARVTFIHAASAEANRLVEVSLNGQVVASAARLNFGRTGTNNWQPRSIWIVLSAGTNRIRLTSLTAAGGPNIDRIEVDDAYAPTVVDWNKAVASTIMSRYPTGASLGAWHYTSTLLMQGLLDVAVRTGNTALQTYIRSWVDSNIDASGAVIALFDELNDFQGGTLLLRLFDLTGDVRYRNAAAGIYARYASYPTTSDGAWLQHTTYPGRQLWLDGTFMSVPFALEYGQRFGSPDAAADEAARQLLVHADHLRDPATGLLYHAYDELGVAPWLGGSGATRSSYFWCRSLGWYGMVLIETLARLPLTHAQRPALLDILTGLAAGYVRYQDPATGLWFQIVDRGDDPDNWVESSCSAMYAYVLVRGVEMGLLDERVLPVANSAFQGLMERVWRGPDRLARFEEVVIGTGPGTLAQYYLRVRRADELHGFGTFVRMYERLGARPPGSVAIWREAEAGTRTAPMIKRFSTSSSGKYFVQAPGADASTDVAPGSGIVRYTLTLPRSAAYRLWGRVNAPDSTLPAFWVRIDGGDWIPWRVGNPSMLWYWDMVRDRDDGTLPATFDLDAGSHRVEIACAQPAARLDRLLVTDALLFFPGNGGF